MENEYTLAQIMVMLEKDNSLKFEYLGDEEHINGVAIHLKNGYDGYVVDYNTLFNIYFNLHSKFKITHKPVGIITAFKAFEKGKKIYCIYNEERFEYTSYPSVSVKNILQDKDRGSISIEEILHGKWFIEI